MLDVTDARNEAIPYRLERPNARRVEVETEVRGIVEDVRLRGDAALLEQTRKLDAARLSADGLRVDPGDISAARNLVPPGFLAALDALLQQCRRTAESSFAQVWAHDGADQANPGELVRPLRRVGVYVSSGLGTGAWEVISAVVPAQVAGVEGIAVCSAPDGSGEIAETFLAACAIAGVTEVYRMGGAQAVAALAYGTETVRPVDMIVGSGGPFARCAQRLVRGWVGTGPEVGPSELVVIADRDASPRLIAADLATNAARGPQGTHAVISDAPDLLTEVTAALDVAVDAHDPSGDIENALIEGGRAIVVRDLDQAIAIANAFAPQFLLLSMADPEAALLRVRNAGSVLVGGDTLAPGSLFSARTTGLTPSGGTARWDSVISPRAFIKTIPVLRNDPSGVDKLDPHLQVLAETERSLADERALGLRSRP